MFKEISYKDLSFTPFNKIGEEWMLITAGDAKKYNTMTASWGALGFIWQKPSATVYIRPQRYTKEFVDNADLFTISFYGKEYKKALALCGAKSGRDIDKSKETGLTPYFVDGTTAFEQASMIMLCKKAFHTPMPEAGFDMKGHTAEFYPDKDFHIMYIGEILKVMVKAF